MSVDLLGITLPLAHFELNVDVVLNGRITAIFGASGSGKTSLIEIIGGLRRPASGIVRVAGITLTNVAAKKFIRAEHRGIGYVPQEGALFPHMSVRQNLLYGFVRTGQRSSKISLQHVTEILEVNKLLDRRVQTLSGGEKQRVALGRALLAGPRLLLLDEALAGLDTKLRDRLLPYFKIVRDEFAISMIFVTHCSNEVMAICDDVLLLSAGAIIQRGSPEALFSPAQTPRYVLRSKEHCELNDSGELARPTS